MTLPRELDLPVVQAVAPYAAADRKRWSGRSARVFPRQAMKDASGASQMDAKTQVTSLHGVSMLDAAQYPLEANVSLALLHEPGGDNDRKLVSVAVGAYVNLHGDATLAAAQAAREAGNAPNAVLAAAAQHRRRAARGTRAAMRALVCIDRFAAAGLQERARRKLRRARRCRRCQAARGCCSAPSPTRAHEAMLAGFERARRRVGVRALPAQPRWPSERRRGARRDHHDARLGTADAQARLAPDGRKPAGWMQLFGTLIGASVDASLHTSRQRSAASRRPTCSASAR